MSKRYLWFNELLPAPTIVTNEDIGTHVKLSKFGFDTDDFLFCSKYDCKEIEGEINGKG